MIKTKNKHNNTVIASQPSLPRNSNCERSEAISSKQRKSLVPKLRFKEFEGEWEETTLGELFTFKNGLNSDKEKYGSGIKFINVLDIIGEDVITYDSIIGMVEVTGKELEKNGVIYGDVLFQRSSETREEVGQANVYVDKNQSAVFGGFVIRGRKKVEYNPYFMNYLLKTSSARKEITTKSGGSTRYNVGQESLSQVYVKSTSVKEQQKIAKFLTAVDTKLQQLTTKKEKLEHYKKGVMQQLFSQQLRFKDDDGSAFPDWEEKKLEKIMNVRNEQAPKSEQYPLMAFIKNKGVAPKGDRYNREFLVNDGDGKKYKKTEYGDFIYSSNNLDTGSIGLNNYGSASISPVYSIFQIKELCDYQFISSFLLRKSFINKMLKYRQGVVYGQWKIHESEVLNIEDSFPSLKEQQKIASYLSAIDLKIEAVQTQLTKTQEFKKGLLQAMFV